MSELLPHSVQVRVFISPQIEENLMFTEDRILTQCVRQTFYPLTTYSSWIMDKQCEKNRYKNSRRVTKKQRELAGLKKLTKEQALANSTEQKKIS